MVILSCRDYSSSIRVLIGPDEEAANLNCILKDLLTKVILSCRDYSSSIRVLIGPDEEAATAS